MKCPRCQENEVATKRSTYCVQCRDFLKRPTIGARSIMKIVVEVPRSSFRERK